MWNARIAFLAIQKEYQELHKVSICSFRTAIVNYNNNQPYHNPIGADEQYNTINQNNSILSANYAEKAHNEINHVNTPSHNFNLHIFQPLRMKNAAHL
jgi:hypothetical protein